MTTRVDAFEFGLTANRFDFTCASAGIVAIVCSAAPKTGGDTALETTTERKTATPKQYQVIVLDDDYTPMEFVTTLLQNVFRLDRDTAVAKTMTIHREGQAVCGTYTYDIALTKADQVIESAQKSGYPLMAVTKPA